MSTSERVRVLVFYGGDAAAPPLNELLAWLRGPAMNIDARTVPDWSPHSEGAIDERVDEAMAWAEKAIALLTADARSPQGAPNVMDEIGRWRGGKGKRSICLLRQEGVPVYSNHSGILSPTFNEKVKERFEELRAFVAQSGPATIPPPSSPTDFIVESNPDTMLIDGHRFAIRNADESQGKLTAILPNLSGDAESVLRDLSPNARIEIAFGNTAISGRVEECRFVYSGGLSATLVVALQDDEIGGAMELAWGGNPPLSADDIASLRASRILFNDPPQAKKAFGIETLISAGGHGAIPVTESPIAGLLARLPRSERSTWETLRLVLIRYLRLSGCVRQVQLLRVTVRGGRLARLEFRGRRGRRFGNEEPREISFDRDVDL